LFIEVLNFRLLTEGPACLLKFYFRGLTEGPACLLVFFNFRGLTAGPVWLMSFYFRLFIEVICRLVLRVSFIFGS